MARLSGYVHFHEYGYGKGRGPDGLKVKCEDWPAWEAGVLLAMGVRTWRADWKFPC